MSGTAGLLVAVVLLGLNAFFVGAEFALVSARRSQIEPLAHNGSRMARSTLRAMRVTTHVISSTNNAITGRANSTSTAWPGSTPT